MTQITKTANAPSHAPGPISMLAGSLGSQIFEEMKDARAPAKHKIVPVVTVSVELTYVKKD